VDAALDAIEPRLEPLGPPVYDCSDCSADVLHGAGLRVELWGNAPEGSAWSRLDRQVEALGSWVRADA
jgi:hypothetical protein